MRWPRPLAHLHAHTPFRRYLHQVHSTTPPSLLSLVDSCPLPSLNPVTSVKHGPEKARSLATFKHGAWVTVLSGIECPASPRDVAEWVLEVLGNAVGSSLLGVYPVPPVGNGDGDPADGGKQVLLSFKDWPAVAQLGSYLSLPRPSLIASSPSAPTSSLSLSTVLASKHLALAESSPSSSPTPSSSSTPPPPPSPTTMTTDPADATTGKSARGPAWLGGRLRLSTLSSSSMAKSYLRCLARLPFPPPHPALQTTTGMLPGPGPGTGTKGSETPPLSRLASPFSGTAVMLWTSSSARRLPSRLTVELGLDDVDVGGITEAVFPSSSPASLPSSSDPTEEATTPAEPPSPKPTTSPRGPAAEPLPSRTPIPTLCRGCASSHRRRIGLRWPGYDHSLGPSFFPRGGYTRAAAGGPAGGRGGGWDGDGDGDGEEVGFGWTMVYCQDETEARALVGRMDRTRPGWANLRRGEVVFAKLVH